MTKKEIIDCVIRRLLLIPYKWGGDDPMGGFDCSGGIQEILASVGLDPKGDQTADALMKYFNRPYLGRVVSDIDFGDLIFFGREDRATHVGIAINPTTMFEFGGGGSKTIDAVQAEKHNAYGRIRPISNRRDFLKAIRIEGL